MRYKCKPCFLVFEEYDIKDKKCPECGNDVYEMCPRDHCRCSHEIIESIAFCPDCKQPMCPECESHDVEQISRITGYLQAVSGFNAGKYQELKDRSRYTVA